MLFASVLALSSLLLAGTQAQQTPLLSTASFQGLWQSMNRFCSTGDATKVNPIARTMTIPPAGCYAVSFQQQQVSVGGVQYQGYCEYFRMSYNSNGSSPGCITAATVWTHGLYQAYQNGTITCTPFGDGSDGFQVIQDPCAAVSVQTQPFPNTITWSSSILQTDVTTGMMTLALTDFSGALPLLWLTSPNAAMLPATQLNNQTTAVAQNFPDNNGLIDTGSS